MFSLIYVFSLYYISLSYIWLNNKKFPRKFF
nr:MAG TPA: hypothetical protein [Bacteriophage sp.]